MARKILLADDSVTAQNMGRKILVDAGYEVIAVNNGSAALKKIAELKPDLVILDVYMPGYSGLEVCQRLKESQETARIPVLLTVGKLEPFKPEEAQRVRAEGYIVKPFEASELLSALSKLEDKVVPRPEPSKPGRFARAIASVDDSDRGAKKNEPSSSETGWKNRISFPHNKPEAEAAETKVDVAAFAPIGVPKDVSPAEVAAITAAVAQMQMADAVQDDRRQGDRRQDARQNQNNDRQDDARASAPAAPEAPVARAAGEFAVEPVLERFQNDRDNSQPSAAELAAAAETKVSTNESALAEISSEPLPRELPAADLDQRRNGDEKLDIAQDAPITMAVSSESAAAASPRWTAVPVALASDEASLSLDHEMQKAYAAFAAADYATSAGSVAAETTAPVDSSPAPEANLELAKTRTPAEETPAAVSNSDLPATEADRTQEISNLESPSLSQSTENIAPAAAISPVIEAEVATPAPEAQVVSEPATQPDQPATASTDSFAAVADAAEPKLDPETVKTTAAAWASWRQTRDTSKSDEPQAEGQQSSAPEPAAADTAALAVAAGAEQASQELPVAAPVATPPESPSDVASIVDSVLAGLRPKLMEEITRKMSEKK